MSFPNAWKISRCGKKANITCKRAMIEIANPRLFSIIIAVKKYKLQKKDGFCVAF